MTMQVYNLSRLLNFNRVFTKRHIQRGDRLGQQLDEKTTGLSHHVWCTDGRFVTLKENKRELLELPKNMTHGMFIKGTAK